VVVGPSRVEGDREELVVPRNRQRNVSPPILATDARAWREAKAEYHRLFQRVNDSTESWRFTCPACPLDFRRNDTDLMMILAEARRAGLTRIDLAALN
jgi:hypothetical protein